MADMTKEQSRAIDEHGPTDNFGAFVQSKLDQGLRGRELSDAIRAEHAAHGKGKGAIKNPGKGKNRNEEARERDARDRDAKDREKDAEAGRDRVDRKSNTENYLLVGL